MLRLCRGEEVGHHLSAINSSWIPKTPILLSEMVPVTHQTLTLLFIFKYMYLYLNLAYLDLRLQVLFKGSVSKIHHQLEDDN